MRVLKEFKEFAMKGNVIDLAIAVIIGTAFGAIVTSLVNDILMPPLGLVLGGMDFKAMAVTLKEATVDAQTGAEVKAVTWNYGMFIQKVIDFLIIAFSIFMVVRTMNRLQRKKEEAPATPPVPSNEEKLLMEIRDELRKR